MGLERGVSGHPARQRTNTRIGISSCLRTNPWFQGFPLQGSAQDPARATSQVVTGSGFLGAGASYTPRGASAA
jgi:uncharacterized membrane protein YhiD involved in acid resistance